MRRRGFLRFLALAPIAAVVPPVAQPQFRVYQVIGFDYFMTLDETLRRLSRRMKICTREISAINRELLGPRP